ncbi:putative transcription factor Hap3/NF-YB family [Rosa chinensis]|uniref:Putative transcription factor Hap3/NF-YB family n=1 Tax=Rosa chinensis TaxID=74649 RepID=A0A2P6SAM0_ROSCH|nr:transcription initiation factor TFIID subunit 4b isoform X2 [Rosa chinensis]PRQ55727.1 putative transcription factor Hap3/NF-YB family [Rosa chinensis]
MYSRADVEAFQAAMNKDIEGNVSTSQLSDSHTAVSSQRSNRTSIQPLQQFHAASQDGCAASRIRHNQKILHQQGLHSFGLEPKSQQFIADYRQQNYDTSEELNQFPLLQEGDLQKGQGEQNTSQIFETIVMSIPQKNPISTQQDITSNPESEFQYLKLPKIGSQKEMITEQSNTPIPSDILLPCLLSRVDRNRGLQLTTLYGKLQKKELSGTDFFRQIRRVVGEQMLRSTVMEIQLQMKSLQPAPERQLSPLAQLPPRMFSISAGSTQLTDPPSFSQYQRGANPATDLSDISSSAVQVQVDSSHSVVENSAKNLMDTGNRSDSHGMQLSQMSSSCTRAAYPKRKCSSASTQVLNEKRQQQLHYPQSSVAMYANTSGQSGGEAQEMNIIGVSKLVMQNSVLEPNRLQGGSHFHFTNNSTLPQNPVAWQSSNRGQNFGLLSSMAYVDRGPDDRASDQQQKPPLNSQGLPSVSAPQVEPENVSPGISTNESFEKHSLKSTSIVPSSAATTVPTKPVSPPITTQVGANFTLGPHIHSRISLAGVDSGTPPGNAFIGKKKPRKAVGSSSQPTSKKQKVSGAFLYQSIEQENDVIAVSCINLREEEEQLLSGPQEDSRASEASGQAVQEEEDERMILQKIPLMKKLTEIVVRCGLKNIRNDVERCLSLCVEERMRGLINNLIGLSKQRVDAQKPRCHTITTSNVQLQIMNLNLAARKEWQVEEQAVQKLSEPDVNNGVNHSKDKDQGCSKLFKANKEEDDKMSTTAANVAALAAVGGDDMLSKWKLIAERARKKREGGFNAPSVSQDVNHKPTTAGRIMMYNQVAEKMRDGAGTIRNFGENQVVMPQTRVVRSISVKDVIAVLEREPWMSKSPLTYLLYERNRSDITVEDSKLLNTVPIIS